MRTEILRASATMEALVVRAGRRRILDGIDLAFEPAVVVLAGPNGAGKTTLLRVLATLRRPSAGQLWVAGVPASQGRAVRQIRQHTGYLA